MSSKEPAREKTTNRLAGEQSPYLLQHARNPVDWYPWGEGAFARARAEDKPVFLSVGYATCHWCHVMARESFENEEVAARLNEVFVPVKVDREERPDVDHLYMTVCQMMTGSGGWPLTVVLTPEGRPFLAGTYFPPKKRFGRIGLLELIDRVEAAWQDRRDELLQSADQITGLLGDRPRADPTELDERLARRAFEQLAGRFDEKHGGFGPAPKFPTPHNLLFLLRYGWQTGEKSAWSMVQKTLEAMRQGGVYDQVGFGFHRYSTDAAWKVPHFEKMLYDQALLALVYTESYQALGDESMRQTADEILAYVLRDLTDAGGAFYSAEDADSEGEEGRFYVWTMAEVREVLTAEETEVARRVFSLTDAGNWSDEATGRTNGTNIPHRTGSPDDVAGELGLSRQALGEILERAREKLLARRETRVRPLCDDKILTDWNGLMIAALARASSILERPGYLAAAERAARFVLFRMRTPQGRLLHRYRAGKAEIPAFLDDYAFLVWGLLELHQATLDPEHLAAAEALTREQLRLFWDEEHGGCFFSATDTEPLVARRLVLEDGALPAGNSVTAHNLLRLGRISGEPEWAARAEALLGAASGPLGQVPLAYGHWLSAVLIALGPTRELTLTGSPRDDDFQSLLRVARAHHHPLLELAHREQEGPATAILCEAAACHEPVQEAGKLAELLRRPLS